MNENNKQIRAGSAISTKISDALRLNWIHQFGNELKTVMRNIFVMNVATYKAIMDIRECLPKPFRKIIIAGTFHTGGWDWPGYPCPYVIH